MYVFYDDQYGENNGANYPSQNFSIHLYNLYINSDGWFQGDVV